MRVFHQSIGAPAPAAEISALRRLSVVLRLAVSHGARGSIAVTDPSTTFSRLARRSCVNSGHGVDSPVPSMLFVGRTAFNHPQAEPFSGRRSDGRAVLLPPARDEPVALGCSRHCCFVAFAGRVLA